MQTSSAISPLLFDATEKVFILHKAVQYKVFLFVLIYYIMCIKIVFQWRPLPQEVPAKIEALLAEYTGKKKVELRDIAKFHAVFENIHPFQDGNGRVGRMILLKQCLDADITPVIIRDKNKIKYYRHLSAAQNKRDYAPLIDFFESEQKWYQEKVIPMIFDYDELQ